MCTLTVIPRPDGGARAAFNRDESPARAAGLPPVVRRFGDRTAALPTDPASGGTWLAVNDAGLALAVLNVNLIGAAPRAAARSRGCVIPSLLNAGSPAEALGSAERLDYRQFAPFRLVLIGHGVVADVWWDGREPMVTSRLLGAPLLFTSSGLGDALVDGPRRALFASLFADDLSGWAAAQHAFHRHRWPGREHLSVNMARDSARTVSHAVIDIGPDEATFAYHPDAPDQSATPTFVRLPLACCEV
jgi:uncharacterized protein with NRDE domain